MISSGPDNVLLTIAPQIVYKNMAVNNNKYRVARSMILCNTSAVTCKVYLSITDNPDTPKKGALLYGLTLDANESLSLSDRRLRNLEHIVVWAQTDNDISFSFDIDDSNV
jgi:hypothetical protein